MAGASVASCCKALPPLVQPYAPASSFRLDGLSAVALHSRRRSLLLGGGYVQRELDDEYRRFVHRDLASSALIVVSAVSGPVFVLTGGMIPPVWLDISLNSIYLVTWLACVGVEWYLHFVHETPDKATSQIATIRRLCNIVAFSVVIPAASRHPQVWT